VNDRLILYLEDIPEEGCRVEGEVSPAMMAMEQDEFIQCESPVRYALQVTVVSGEFIAGGALATEARLRCCRCSVFFPTAVEETEYYYDQEVDETTESVDLTEDMREAIILALPSYPVCGAECKGLCPQCGANKNEGECQCKPPADDRWAALDGLG
jgi:uncharacterized protein